MNVLVVGGSGFIGSEIVRHIRKRGQNADVIDIRPGDSGVKTVVKDIKDGRIRDLDLSAYDIVMILAAVTSQIEFEKNPAESFAANVDGLFNLLEACRKSKVRKVLFASSSAVYGNVKKRMSEVDSYRPNNMYATSKVIGEYMFNAYLHKNHFEGVIVRYFNTYGFGENTKGDYKSIISIFLEEIKLNSEVVVYGDGEQRRDFINVRDAARISFELALHHTGTFNVGSGKSISWNEILQHLKDRGLQFKARFIPNPINDYQYFTEANIDKMRSAHLQPTINIKDGTDELISYYNLAGAR